MDIKEKKRIEDDVHRLLKKFGKDLADVSVEERTHTDPIENSGFREEGAHSDSDAEFKKRFLANAPKATAHAIIAEKKAW